MKQVVADYVLHCFTCQQVKAEHQKPAGLLEQIEIHKWKWEWIIMDFVIKLPHSPKGYHSIWVIVDRLTKTTHFLPMKTTYNVVGYAHLYLDEIMMLYRVLVSIISYQCPRFTSQFWRSLQEDMGTWVDLSTPYHPQKNGQSKRTIQTLEDILRACVMDFGKSWETIFHLSSLPTTIAINPIYRWHHLRLRMIGDVALKSDGLR